MCLSCLLITRRPPAPTPVVNKTTPEAAVAYSVSSSSTHFGGGSDHLAQDLSPGTRLMAGPLSLFVLQPQPLSLETSTLITRWPGWESFRATPRKSAENFEWTFVSFQRSSRTSRASTLLSAAEELECFEIRQCLSPPPCAITCFPQYA